MRPHGAWPRGVAGGAADDVDVHLPHLIADAGDVEFFRLEMTGDESGDGADDVHHFVVDVGRELVEVFDAGDFGDNEEPGKQGVVLEQHAAAAEAAEFVAAGGKAGVEGEVGHGIGRWGWGRLALPCDIAVPEFRNSRPE